jgi:hypothetical protein
VAPLRSMGRQALAPRSQFPPAETVEMQVEDGLPGIVMGIARKIVHLMAYGAVGLVGWG